MRLCRYFINGGALPVIAASKRRPRQASPIIQGLANVAGGFMPKQLAISAVSSL